MKKLCRCGVLIDYKDKYCNDCITKIKEDKKDTDRYYNKYQRDKEVQKFYESKAWRRVRNKAMDRYNGLDIYSLFILQKIEFADQVHHIEELKESPNKRLMMDNLIPLTIENHNKIDGMYNDNKKATQLLLKTLKKRYETEF